ncbi:hypothetical protein [Pontibacter virosus]|uniref:Uncharacterized protein n=1 Tax=Pontibacter virosus TaxID=1765052 RepID=A0A2U1B025_9BACT|nr:hypothetical protein [Pontibacter virosus]PVY41847.1 hypothetical protein C8E01_104219 [Pontibacter virosus]
MLYLILRVLPGVSLVFPFRLYQHFNVHSFQAIAVYYVTCIAMGLTVLALVLLSYQGKAAHLF